MHVPRSRAGLGWRKDVKPAKVAFRSAETIALDLAREFRERTPLRNQAETDPDFPYCHRFAIRGQGCYAVQPR
jgi:hypothetical protein